MILKNTRNKSESEILRQKAEVLLKKQGVKSGSQLSELDTLKLIHELEVHQIELEIQKDELRNAWAKSEISTDKFTELYEFAPIGYFTLSKEGEIIELNHRGAEMLDKERQRCKNSRFGFFISDNNKPIFNLFLAKVFNSKTKESCEVTLSSDRNSPMCVQLTGIVTKNERQCLLIAVDITDRKRHETEIKLKNEQLIQANAEKDKFFSIIAHDLRSPFNAFMGFTELMVKDLPTLTSERIQKMALGMRTEATKLFNLLNNLLEWSMMQRGMISSDPESFIVLNGIVPIVELVRHTANKKMIGIVCDIPDDLRVLADAQMFKSLMSNLVFNAVKFTPKGGSVSINAKPISEGWVEISIKDTGIGMNKSIVDKLFRLDEQTNRRGTDGEPSSGLGLLLCKEFVEKHGGA
jgi:signal transduction histidine kinase